MRKGGIYSHCTSSADVGGEVCQPYGKGGNVCWGEVDVTRPCAPEAVGTNTEHVFALAFSSLLVRAEQQQWVAAEWYRTSPRPHIGRHDRTQPSESPRPSCSPLRATTKRNLKATLVEMKHGLVEMEVGQEQMEAG